jgi:prepilin-type N-terminal cleavage/methylation domain-containing protein
MPMRKPDQRGVTMVELLVAMVLMAVALLVLAAAFPYALYGVVVGGAQAVATFLAQEAVERATGADYGSLPSLSFDGSTGALPADCDVAGRFRPVAAFPGFTRCVAVEPAAPSPATTTITAVVEFRGPTSSATSRTTVTTIRAH